MCLVLKHSDASLVTYICRQMKHLKHVSETLAKTLETIATNGTSS
jgi:hypothetical protein